MASGVKTYAEVVEQALTLERLEQESSQAREKPRNNTRQGFGQNAQFRKSSGSGQNRGQTSQFRPNFSGPNKRKFEGNRS